MGDSAAADRTPYMQRGKCFLECLLSMLTGSLAPCRDNQFADLDHALGIELGVSTTMRRFFHHSVGNPHRLVNSLCGLLRRKFHNQMDESAAEWVLRRALERHPMLVDSCTRFAQRQQPHDRSAEGHSTDGH